jgi:hypothetical protein
MLWALLLACVSHVTVDALVSSSLRPIAPGTQSDLARRSPVVVGNCGAVRWDKLASRQSSRRPPAWRPDSRLLCLDMREQPQDAESEDKLAWDREETERFKEMLTKAIRTERLPTSSEAPIAKPQMEPGGTGTGADLSASVELESEVRAAAYLPLGIAKNWYESWRAFIKNATKKARESSPSGEAPPRARGFYYNEAVEREDELTAIGKWQRTDGPFYVQFGGAMLLLLGFLNYIALNNQNGTGVDGLSQPLWTCSIFVTLLGFALERKDRSRSDGS